MIGYKVSAAGIGVFQYRLTREIARVLGGHPRPLTVALLLILSRKVAGSVFNMKSMGSLNGKSLV